MSADPKPAPLPTIGSSDAAAILGMSPWASPWDAWMRLVGLVPRYDSTGSDATRRGNMLEPAIGLRYAEDQQLQPGVNIFRGPAIGEPPFPHPTLPWLAVRPDLLVYAGERREVECKSARKLDADDGWGEPGTDAIPRHYVVQVLVQLAVLAPSQNMERADVAAFGTIDDDWRVYVLRRRERLEASILARLGDWYEAHVVDGRPPVIDGSEGCGRALTRLHGSPDRRWLDPTPADLALARDLAAVRRQILDLETRKAELEHRIQDRIGDAYGIRQVATWMPRRGRTGIDADRLRRELPEVAAKYTTTGEAGRTFRLIADQEGNES